MLAAVVRILLRAGLTDVDELNEMTEQLRSLAERRIDELAEMKLVASTPPQYYTRGSIEPWHVIADWGLDYWLGTVVAYLQRAGHKPGCSELDDLLKARATLNERIRQLEEAGHA
jgi:hypothetical protein